MVHTSIKSVSIQFMVEKKLKGCGENEEWTQSSISKEEMSSINKRSTHNTSLMCCGKPLCNI